MIAVWRFSEPCDEWCLDPETLYDAAGERIAHFCRSAGNDRWYGQAICGPGELRTGPMTTRDSCRHECEHMAGVRPKN